MNSSKLCRKTEKWESSFERFVVWLPWLVYNPDHRPHRTHHPLLPNKQQTTIHYDSYMKEFCRGKGNWMWMGSTKCGISRAKCGQDKTKSGWGSTNCRRAEQKVDGAVQMWIRQYKKWMGQYKKWMRQYKKWMGQYKWWRGSEKCEKGTTNCGRGCAKCGQGRVKCGWGSTKSGRSNGQMQYVGRNQQNAPMKCYDNNKAVNILSGYLEIEWTTNKISLIRELVNSRS